MSGDPVNQLIDTVDPQGCQITNLPDRIWVFGGPCEKNESPSSSLRDSFWRKTLSASNSPDWFNALDRPEDHDGWWAFSGYEDLLEFERDACYLARATVLFSESPGSHAELGALALDPSILPRLLVVVQSKFLTENERESFLNLGPIERVHRQGGRRCVIGTAQARVLSDDDFLTISDEISSWLPGVPQKALFQTKNNTHVLLLLADIVDLLIVCKTGDIQKVLIHFGVEMQLKELERALNLLAFFRLVVLQLRGTDESPRVLWRPFGLSYAA